MKMSSRQLEQESWGYNTVKDKCLGVISVKIWTRWNHLKRPGRQKRRGEYRILKHSYIRGQVEEVDLTQEERKEWPT